MSKLKSLIYQNSSKLNDSEIRIIQFVLDNAKLCKNLSLSELAEKLYVSRSAIFRLCKHLGLSGYTDTSKNKVTNYTKTKHYSIHSSS